MSGVLKVIGAIAGAVAVVAGALFTFGVGTAAFAAMMGKVAAIAGAVAGVASLGAQILARPPPARGSVSNVTISRDAPAPYWMGEGLVGGVLRHDVGYGATLNKVPNPYKWMPIVYSVAGPIALITPYIEQEPIGSYYTGFVYTDTQLGAVPEASALAPNFSGAPGWDSTSKLSGCAAIGWNLKFDKDGKVFSAGVPRLAAYGQGVRVYDPRLDSTYPGGSGGHRANDEDTWEYSANPALHAGTYALGRHVDGKRVIGLGMAFDTIDWTAVVTWANTCEDNGWTLFGVAWEGGAGADLMAQRVGNLRDICAAGGGEFSFSGGKLSFNWAAPRVALDTFTDEDLVSDDGGVTAMASYRDRVNTVVPTFVSADHDWELVPAEPVVASTYVTEDGRERKAEWPLNFVKDVDQVAQLGAYRLVDTREIQPITLTFGERCLSYRPGEVVHLTIERLGLDHDALILTREVDAATLAVTFTFRTEDPDKHAFALGQTGTPPPTPALGQTAEERDAIAAAVIVPAGLDETMIAQSYPTDADPSDGLIQATDTAITIESHTRTYPDKTVSVTGATLTVEDDGTTAIVATTLYHVYYDDAGRAGGAVSLKATQDPTVAANSPSNPARHYLGSITSDTTGGSGTSYGGSIPPGWTYDNWNNL